MSVDPTLKALFEINRRQIILGAKDQAGEFNFPQAYLYAVATRISPVFHTDGHEEDPFESIYSTNTKFVTEVVEWLDKEEQDGRGPTFYELEGKFGHENRADLIHIVRYCALDHRFSDDFYGKLLKNGDCPTEASRSAEPFRESDLSLM